MLVNLTDVLTTPDKVKEELISIQMKRVVCGREEYPIVDKSDIAFTFTNIGKNKALIEGQVWVILEIPCSRCLHTVMERLQLRFTHKVTVPDGLSQSEEEDELLLTEDYNLNVEDLIYHEIIINLPAKVLCREDCKGICKECGQNLNERECGCDTFVPDPRMAAIKDIFNANKEV